MGMLELATARQRKFEEVDRGTGGYRGQASNQDKQQAPQQERGQQATKEQQAGKQQEPWHNYAQNQRDEARAKVQGNGLGKDRERDEAESKVAREQENNFHQKHGRYHRSGEELDKATYEHDRDPKVIRDRQTEAYRSEHKRYPRSEQDLDRWNQKQAQQQQDKAPGQDKAQEQGQAQQPQEQAASKFGAMLESRRSQGEQGKEQGSQQQGQRVGPPSLDDGVKAAREDARSKAAQMEREKRQGKTMEIG